MWPRRSVLTLITAGSLVACAQELSGPEASGSLDILPADVSAARGAITIVLDMQPNRPVDVSYMTTGKKLRNFTLDDDVTSALSNSRTFTRLRARTYELEQVAVPGLTLVAITCVSDANGGGGTDNNTVDLAKRSVTIELERDESVACTFVGKLPIWQAGDLVTYDQNDWGESSTTAGTLLNTKFISVYGSALVVGGTSTMTFTSASSVFSYLPALGTPGIFEGSTQNPQTTSAGEFGGEVVALKVNVDFSDADLLANTTPLGDLRICNFSVLPVLDGQTVRQFLATANSILGGDGGPFGATTASAVSRLINAAFLNGGPSVFAQEILVVGACP